MAHFSFANWQKEFRNYLFLFRNRFDRSYRYISLLRFLKDQNAIVKSQKLLLDTAARPARRFLLLPVKGKFRQNDRQMSAFTNTRFAR